MSWHPWVTEQELKNGIKTSQNTSAILEEIAKIKKKGHNLSIEESKRLSELQKQLAEKQAKCNHFWKLVLLFNRHSRFCEWCDKEDFDYVHKD